MKFIKGLVVVMGLLLGASSLQAQDIHFSQFYAMPLQLNPALTGFTPGKYRVSGIFRSQWFGIAPYSTQGLAVDFSPKLPFLSTTDFPGVGLIITNDVTGTSGSAGLSRMRALGSFALNKGFGRWYFGLGAQFGFNQTAMRGEHTYPGDWDGQKIDGTNVPSLSGEALFDAQTYADLNVGALATFRFGLKEVNSAFLGVSSFHINRPTTEFQQIEHVPMRMVINGGSRIAIPQSPYTVVPNFIFMASNMKRVANWTADGTGVGQEIVFGLSGEYDFSAAPGSNSDMFVSLGGYYRNQDAIIFNMAIGYDDIVIGLSYDVTSSEFNRNNGRDMTGAFEVSLRFTPIPNTLVRRLSSSPCPRI